MLYFSKISIEVEAKDYVNYDYNLSDESSNIELLNEELENYLDLYEDYLIFNKKISIVQTCLLIIFKLQL